MSVFHEKVRQFARKINMPIGAIILITTGILLTIAHFFEALAPIALMGAILYCFIMCRLFRGEFWRRPD